MTVKELCAEHGLKFQTVYKKIKNHQCELDGHITKIKGASLELDEFAVDFLLPIQVKVLQAVDECEAIARENDELTEKLHSVEATTEQTEKQLSEALADNKRLIEEIDSLKADSSDRDIKIGELTKQFETERNTFRQTVTELEKRVTELTEENRLLTEKYEAIPKIFRKKSVVLRCSLREKSYSHQEKNKSFQP